MSCQLHAIRSSLGHAIAEGSAHHGTFQLVIIQLARRKGGLPFVMQPGDGR